MSDHTYLKNQPYLEILSQPSIEQYCTYLGANTQMAVWRLKDLEDGHEQSHTRLRISSIERGDAQNRIPHIIRGIIDVDANRPGEDCSAMMLDHNVVIECQFWIPRTLVFTNPTAVNP